MTSSSGLFKVGAVVKIYLQPERIIFTIIAAVGFVAQMAYLVAAYRDKSYLTRLNASAVLMLMTGPHMGSEWARMVTMTGVLFLGLISFTAAATPRTLFGAIASAVIILVVLEIEVVSFADYRRRQFLLDRPDSRVAARNIELREERKNGNGAH